MFRKIILILGVFCVMIQASRLLANTVPVVVESRSSLERQAGAELAVFLGRLYPGERFNVVDHLPEAGKCILVGRVTTGKVARLLPDSTAIGAEGYIVKSVKDDRREVGIIAGVDSHGVVYGVYGLLEKLGCGFYLSGDTMPAARREPFTFDGWQMTSAPLVSQRLVFNWHNFVSGCSAWNLEHWNAWTLQAQKMGYNAIMVHAYGNAPYFTFRFNGKRKPTGYLSTTVRGRDWATMHVNDVRRLVGGHVFDRVAFGADAGLVPESEREAAAQKLMGDAFKYAASRGMDVCLALDVDTGSANPQELILTLPESARFEVQKRVNPKAGEFWLANPDTPEGYGYYKAQLDSLLAAYPQITDLVLWFRGGGTPWVNLKAGQMPETWQREYQAAIEQHPEAANYWQSAGMFAIGKMVGAYERALNEMKLDRIRFGVGTWGSRFLPACDRFMPAHVKFVWLDADAFGNKSFDSEQERTRLGEFGARRTVIPIAWAHHDDNRYIGRSYTPFVNFADKLAEMKAQGFGVCHWTTRPLDLYLKSLSEQVWSTTRNRPLRTTCDAMAERWFGPSARSVMGEYLERWVTDAPIFARETSFHFMDNHPSQGAYAVANATAVIAGCKSRAKLIEEVDPAALSPEQRDRVNYFKGLEAFIAAFYPCHQKLDRSVQRLKDRDLDGSRIALTDARPEEVIERFARFSSLGGITRGEQGLVVSMNTRWLTHFIRQKQALGMEPIRYNFGPTSHDPLAQSAGPYTFHVDAAGRVWQTFGEKETKAKVFVLPASVRIERPDTMPVEFEEIGHSGIESDTYLSIPVRPIMQSAPLPAGEYKLRLLMIDPFSKAEGQRVFSVAINTVVPDQIDDGGQRSNAGQQRVRKNQVVRDEVDIFKEAGRPARLVERAYAVKLDKGGTVEVAFRPIKGTVLLSGIVLEPVK